MEHCLTTAQPSAPAAKSHRRQAMSGRLLRAVRLLEEGGHTCVLCKDELVLTSGKRGVLPLIEWIEQGRNLKGFSAADKIVGRASALLFVLAGVREIYASVMSEGALSELEKHGIPAYYGSLVPAIINRQGTGICPMEQAVLGISDPAQALAAVKRRQQELRQAAGQEKQL